MLLYNWNIVYELSGGSAVEITRIFRMLVLAQIPKNKFDPLYRYEGVDFSGESFLVHPDMLAYNTHKHSHKDICQYLALASLRPLADYLASGLVRLPVDMLEIDLDVLLTYVQQNELIGLKGANVLFKYEELSEQSVH